MDDKDTYNGWLNFETWNVALWIHNDVGVYEIARSVARHGGDYKTFALLMREMPKTPDGVPYDDSRLDLDALNELMRDL